MASHTIDSLAQLIESMGRDLRDHREEAAASVQRLNEKFDEKFDALKEELIESRATAKTVEALDATVNGKGDEPGLKGRQDRTERTVAGFLWIGLLLIGAVVGLVFDFISKHLPGAKS